MPFKAGQVKTPGSGRKAGTPNSPKLPRIDAVLSKAGVDPATEVLKILQEKNAEGAFTLSAPARMNGWLELMSYCHAKPKAMEVEQEDDLALEQFAEVETAKLLEFVKTNGAQA